jgi:hypothetical protein
LVDEIEIESSTKGVTHNKRLQDFTYLRAKKNTPKREAKVMEKLNLSLEKVENDILMAG